MGTPIRTSTAAHSDGVPFEVRLLGLYQENARTVAAESDRSYEDGHDVSILVPRSTFDTTSQDVVFVEGHDFIAECLGVPILIETYTSAYWRRGQ